MLNRLSRITGTFKELDKLTNIMYNLEKSISGFKLQIHNIQKVDMVDDVYEMIFSVPCNTYYRGLKELEKAVVKVDDKGSITIYHKFEDTGCYIEFDLKNNVTIYYKNAESAYPNRSKQLTVDWSKSFEPFDQIITELFNEFGYIFDSHPLSTTMCNISNYYNGDEERKRRILKEAWNIELR